MKKTSVAWLFLLFLCNCSAQGTIVHEVAKTNVEEALSYYLYYPEDYSDNAGKHYGLLLFLHGGGGSGRSVEEIKKAGPPQLLASGKQFPFLVLAPNNPHKKQWWNTRAVLHLLDAVVKENKVDPNRIYLSGLSRGGGAAWELAVQHPNRFAALAVVCGMAPTPYAHWIDKEMPIWVFHGGQDSVIPVTESDDMVKKLRELGHQVHYTRYEGAGHEIWNKVYNNDKLYQWLKKQKRE